jgi:hypothetical protein
MRVCGNEDELPWTHCGRRNDKYARGKSQGDIGVANAKRFEEFRGMVGYYRQYIETFSKKAEPLNEVVRKKTFEWNKEEKKVTKREEYC